MYRPNAFFSTVSFVLILLSAVPRFASGAALSPGDILVADQVAGVIRHYSATGADLGVFVGGLSTPSYITVDQKRKCLCVRIPGGKGR
jgi:hypothetical protein